MKPKRIPVKNYHEFVAAVNALFYKGWIFRGHSDLSWHLEPSLARFFRTHWQNIEEKKHDSREYDSIRKFQKAAHQYISHLPSEDDLCSWLAVMQHFGSPTRLTTNAVSAGRLLASVFYNL